MSKVQVQQSLVNECMGTAVEVAPKETASVKFALSLAMDI